MSPHTRASVSFSKIQNSNESRRAVGRLNEHNPMRDKMKECMLYFVCMHRGGGKGRPLWQRLVRKLPVSWAGKQGNDGKKKQTRCCFHFFFLPFPSRLPGIYCLRPLFFCSLPSRNSDPGPHMLQALPPSPPATVRALRRVQALFFSVVDSRRTVLYGESNPVIINASCA